jgi:putative DNA methylase
MASQGIEVNLVSSWNEFAKDKQAALIINGSSDDLPIPDGVVDLVITDPPYFDFIHYSELSDFFFAWLSPALKERYSFFQGNDSSHPGEVQHKEPKVFAQQLSRVFSECYRVLEKDGLLIFSFHHSQPDGWMAICEAIQNSSFKVVAAYPVYAEMKVASPKTSAKEPISLDAIIVCRKDEKNSKYGDRIVPVETKIKKLEEMIESSGIKLSKSDRFIILASQLLIGVFNKSISVEDMDFLLQQQSITPNKTVGAEQSEGVVELQMNVCVR